ncbi:BON domain-containing protein [Blastopirellula sp. J2-11]|uniref:BON domain-containing protein n=1 Tax=Blastopirellula sp. J2-11 TaxID=2943192 RepID=UPI0021CA2788|nr:BON domain-containing protein [Blastopirellula sp. J2-11]UUO04476.1 BON domain-containing protein [Blastopirellula sp. J2-11]
MRSKYLAVVAAVASCLMWTGSTYAQSLVNQQTFQQPSSNFGATNSGGAAQSINAGASAFSNLPATSAPTLNGTSTGTGSTSGASSAAGGDSGVAAAAAQMTQQNAISPFAASGTTGQAGSRNSMSQFARGMGAMFGNQGFGQNFGAGTDDKRIPTRMVVKFNHPTIPSTTVARSIRRTLPWPNVAVSMEGPVATLTGSVDSADLRALAERYVKMEPGVSAVKNELQIAPQPLPQ